MNIFGIGLPEMAVIAAIGLLVFGPKRLPELGKTLGRTLKGFQSASQDFEKEFRSALSAVEASDSSTTSAAVADSAVTSVEVTDVTVAEPHADAASASPEPSGSGRAPNL